MGILQYDRGKARWMKLIRSDQITILKNINNLKRREMITKIKEKVELNSDRGWGKFNVWLIR